MEDVSLPLPAVVTDDDAAVLTSLVVEAGNDFRSIIFQRFRSDKIAESAEG